MPDQAHAGGLEADALRGLVGPQHVLPDRIPRGGVVEGHLVALVGGLEPGEEVERCALRDVLGPPDGGGGGRGERRDFELAENRQIVVADQGQRAALGDEARALVGLRAVADHVAEAPGLVDPRRAPDLGEHRFEGGQVRVDVRDDRESHRAGGKRSGLS